MTAPSGSVITVNGLLAQFDATTGNFFVNNFLIGPGDNTLTVVITAPNGVATTRTVVVTGTDVAKFQVDLTPERGQAPFSTDLYLRRLGGNTFTSVRVTCDSIGAPLISSSYLSAAVIDRTAFTKCAFGTVGSYAVLFEFLDGTGAPIERHTRRVIARAAASDATAALTTYYSFLSLLLDNNLAGAVNVGFIDSYRSQWQTALSGLTSTQLASYATNMFNIQELRTYDRFAELVVALPSATGIGSEFCTVRLEVDQDGFWRIESL